MTNERIELALGTVQFGVNYGVSGRGEVVPEAEVREILHFAWDAGIRVLDTAAAYGDIEERLHALTGNRDFSIVSKIPPVPLGLDSAASDSFIKSSIGKSKARLRSKLKALLFHNADDLRGERGRRSWDAASAALTDGALKLGVSCYSPQDAASLKRVLPIETVQVPGNAFDQRIASDELAAQLSGVEIHLRSAFLQGLLLQSSSRAAALVPSAAGAMQAWEDWCRAHALSPLEGALSAVKSFANVRYCVVGVDNLHQLKSIAAAWSAAKPVDASVLASNELQVIDPRKWKAA